MGRPEALFPLFSKLTRLEGIGPKSAQLLESLRIQIPRDALFCLPYAVVDRRPCLSIRQLSAPSVATLEVEVRAHIAPKSSGRPYRVEVRDFETSFFLVFFHARKDWLARQLPIGAKRVISGKLELFDGVAQMVHPDYIVAPEAAGDIPEFEPVYPLTHGISQKLMTRLTWQVLEAAPDLDEWIDPILLSQKGWPSWREALASVHRPKEAADLSLNSPARLRLAYDEFFAHQLTLALARARHRRVPGITSRASGKLQKRVLEALSFRLTDAQERAIADITVDMASTHRMSRLLQGDVGSGKTLVALMALLVAVEAGGQGALMVPTEILARQHFTALQPLAQAAGVEMALLTGRDKGQERKSKLAALAVGDIQVLMGTHALFQNDVVFRDLRLAVIDEQHRFGVGQRLALGDKGRRVDILVMTATPIPRSLALAQYGDMELSVLNEKPPGRQPITTALISTERLSEVVARLRAAVLEGRQAYWVCPLVEESELSDLTSAQHRFERLRAQLGEGNVGLVHGQMASAEKDAAMAAFVAGETAVLVATTVIEVGVDVPNASIIVIERAEGFGLAQLHQLRGRVGRGSLASTCLLVYQNPLSETARRRLEIMRQTEDGFVIAEEDLAIRGAGDMIGAAQSGVPRFRVADLEQQSDIFAIARDDARALLTRDPQLESPRGVAARHLLWLLGQDKAISLINVG